jgi:hypothetical protein
VLDDVLGQARHLLLDFDGVICRLYQPHARAEAADRLLAVLTSSGALPGETIPAGTDPLAILGYAAAAGDELGRLAEAELADGEMAAVPAAEPNGYVHDMIASARDSGRRVTVISSCGPEAVGAYLKQAGLASLTGPAVTRIPSDAASASPGSLIARCSALLKDRPGTLTLISAWPDLLEAAASAGIAAIRYQGDRGSHAAGDTPWLAVSSLADLVLWLRAHPVRDNLAEH